MNLLETLRRNRLINSLVKWIRLNTLFDIYLARFPLVKRTTQGLLYRICSVPALVVANEIFCLDGYKKSIESVSPTTFVDLGANVGFFAVSIADIVKSRGIKGLCIEANPELCANIEFHVKVNNLDNVHVRHGAVGPRNSPAEVDFFVNPSHIASSLSGMFNPLLPVGGKYKQIRVPVIRLPEEWDTIFPGERINLLKIDIEGAEIEFLQSHSQFLELVDAIVIEWHAWITSLSEVKSLLEQHGFSLIDVYEDDQHAGTALFKKLS